MYSSLKNHSNNLQYSERFYHNAYQYYNDYQQPQDYQEDLSKLFFKCKRKTQANIWVYADPNHQVQQENRYIRVQEKQGQLLGQEGIASNNVQTDKRQNTMMGEQQQQNDGKNNNQMREQLHQKKSHIHTTMEQLFDPFVEVYETSNFSDFKGELEENKNKMRIIYYPQQRNFKQKASSQRGKNFNLQLDFIQHLMDSFQTKVKVIKQLYEQDNIDVNDMSYYASQLAFQAFNLYQLDALLKNKDEGTKVILNYSLFKSMIQSMLDELCDSESYSHLILFIPKLPVLNYFFNPLISGIYSFLRKQQSLSKSDYHKTEQAERELPKIVLINLDSKEIPQNIRTIHQCPAIGLMYVTIYTEALHHQLIQDEEDQISEMISKLLIKQIHQANLNATQDKRNKSKNYTEVPKIFAFPLNSKYIKNQMREKYGSNDVNCTLTGTSEDIMFLFDNVIFEEIRNFAPNIIMINYNGSLHVNEQHFSKIIRTLTVISDHRIILFPNLCNLFETQTQTSLKVPSEEFIQNKQLNEETLLKVKSYLQKYQEIDITQIDMHNFLNNLALFLKISSGTYSFQQRHYSQSTTFQKYETGLKYEYLERLSELDQFKYYSKFISKHLKGSTLMKLMEKERKQCIQKNDDNIPLYKSVLAEAIQDLWNQSQSVPNTIKFKLKKIMRSLDDKEQKLEQYFQLKKERLMVETIKCEKVKKSYYVKASPREGQQDSLYVFTFRENSQEKEQIFLQNYSQVIYQQILGKYLNVFVINVRNDNDELKIMFGQTKINSYEVYLTSIEDETKFLEKKMQLINLSCDDVSFLEYVNYSYTFYKNSLYLFWPYEWDLKLEAQSLIVGIDYCPKVCNRMIRVNVEMRQDHTKVTSQPVYYEPKNDIIPKIQVGAWAQSENKIFIFGGITDSKRDFECIDSGVSIMTIENNKFWITNIPKSLNQVKIRPKLNYVVDQKDQNTLTISGGHGRQFTNFFNIFSYHSYEFDTKNCEVKVGKCMKKVVQLPKPMFTRKEGRFDMAKDRGTVQNSVKIQERLSNQPKYKFILCRKGFYNETQSNKSTAITFLDDDYTTTVYNKQSSYNHIFSSNKIFDNIYSQRNCSPEIYVWDKSRELIRIEILVEVSKQVNEYSMKEFIFPNEDSLIAFCIHSNREKIYLLAKSAIYTRNVYILYEGSLKNSDQIAIEKQLKMRIFFEFKSSVHKLQQKAIYSQDHRLMICGGNLNNYGVREDFFLERIRGKYKLKTVKISYPLNPLIVEMQNPYILQTLEDEFYLYNVSLNSNEKWIVKLEHFSSGKNKRVIKESEISLNTIFQRHCYKISQPLMKLHFLNVSKYSKFSFEYLKSKAHALLIEINKLQEDFDLNQLEQQIKVKVLLFILKNTSQTIEAKMSYIYFKFKRFVAFIIKEKTDDAFYLEKSILAWEIILILVNYKIEQGFLQSLSLQERKRIDKIDLYRFILEDRSRPLTKYVGLSTLGTTKISFFQIKTRKSVVSSMVSSIQNQDQYGINIGQKSCNQVYFDEFSNYKNDVQYERIGQWKYPQQIVYDIQSQVFLGNQN